MMTEQPSLSIMVPALNEEANFAAAASSMIADCGRHAVDWELVIIDDGSTDATPRMAQDLAGRYPQQIKIVTHEKPMGIGKSVWDGLQAATKETVTWLPGDGENDPGEIFKYLPLMKHVDFIVPYVTNKDVRSRARRLLSRIFTTIVNTTFGTFFNYTNGNVIYKRSILKDFVQESTGFFFQTECIIKSSRRGYIFAEVPIRIRRRLEGESKALTFKSLKSVTRDYFKLVRSVYLRP
ncbi:MAG: glycosyltransferase [Candidatus Omnitrophica bacterium]|nr:glycosyltransferase [Candidatus Omnitrophota bacterium]